MKSKTFLLIFVFILLAVPACSAKPPSLYNSAWILTELNGKPVETFLREPYFEQNFEPFQDFYISLRFSKNKISGKAGCNKYEGPYFALGNYLFTGKVFSNLMSCLYPEDINQQSTDYFRALARANHYENSGDQLRLLDLDDNVLAVFTAQSQELADTRWQVISFIKGSWATLYPVSGTQITLHFSDDGRLSGSGGCNGYFGNYETENGSIQITERGNSLMACEPAGLMDQEAQYFQALASVTTYWMEGNTLELYTADDKIAISLVKAP